MALHRAIYCTHIHIYTYTLDHLNTHHTAHEKSVCLLNLIVFLYCVYAHTCTCTYTTPTSIISSLLSKYTMQSFMRCNMLLCVWKLCVCTQRCLLFVSRKRTPEQLNGSCMVTTDHMQPHTRISLVYTYVTMQMSMG